MTTGPEQLPDGTDGFRLELTETETERWHREAVFADAERTGPEVFPRLTNMSAGHFYPTLIRPDVPTRPEYVTLPIRLLPGSRDLGEAATVGQWNMLWETGPYRRRFFDVDELPAALATLAETGDVNVNVVPRTTSRYLEYAPLYHLLPRRTLERFGLPLLHAGQWPFVAALADHDRLLAADFHERLQRAWANAVWPHLNSGSQESAFTRDDPIRLLAHNLDFWLPPVTEVITQTLLDFDIVDSGGPTGPVLLQDGSFLPGATCGGARQGGDVWRGEADAAHALAWTVEQADATGQLRGILEAVKAHRVADDFSDRWSFAKEDFERKLHRKRSKVSVRFVELTDTIPVQGPESEVVGNLVTADFMALLDPVDRQVVVLLRSGMTSLTDVAGQLGYANHSAVSKRLTRIRQQARAFFDEFD